MKLNFIEKISQEFLSRKIFHSHSEQRDRLWIRWMGEKRYEFRYEIQQARIPYFKSPPISEYMWYPHPWFRHLADIAARD